MSVFDSSLTNLLGYLNAANGVTTFTADNLVFSVPKPVAGTWREATTTKNTYMKVSPGAGASFSGTTVITYNRLQLGDFAHFKPSRQLPAYLPATTHDLLPNLLHYFGIRIGAEDILDEALTLDVNGAGTVTLNADPNSPIWLGSITFNVVEGGADIAALATTTDLNGLNYPVNDPNTQTSALLYAYPFDATAYRDTLLAIPDATALSSVNADQLVTIFKALDQGGNKDSWNNDPATTTWSLSGATVTYNGLNSMALPTNQSYKYVMGIELRSDVTTPSGIFYIHYNDPDDPNSAD